MCPFHPFHPTRQPHRAWQIASFLLKQWLSPSPTQSTQTRKWEDIFSLGTISNASTPNAAVLTDCTKKCHHPIHHEFYLSWKAKQFTSWDSASFHGVLPFQLCRLSGWTDVGQELSKGMLHRRPWRDLALHPFDHNMVISLPKHSSEMAVNYDQYQEQYFQLAASKGPAEWICTIRMGAENYGPDIISMCGCVFQNKRCMTYLNPSMGMSARKCLDSISHSTG